MATKVPQGIEYLTPDEILARTRRGLKRAIQNEVARLRREGLPVWIWKDGKVVNDNPRGRRKKAAKARSSPRTPRRGR